MTPPLPQSHRSIATSDEVLDTALKIHDGAELPPPYCGSDWHQQRHSDETCPECGSPWWATDGSEPYEPALYWLQILARRR
jgi:hypothetical protein